MGLDPGDWARCSTGLRPWTFWCAACRHKTAPRESELNISAQLPGSSCLGGTGPNVADGVAVGEAVLPILNVGAYTD